VPGLPKGIADWSPENDVWELYDLSKDWSQADDLAAQMPEKVEKMKDLFLLESTKNDNLPIGGGLWTVVFHPEDKPSTPYTEWTFSGSINRMPEFAAPRLGNTGNVVKMEVELDANANGVLYALGGFSGGLACYLQDGVLCYEYNLFEITRTQVKGKTPLAAGKHTIEVESKPTAQKPGAPLEVTLKVDGAVVASGTVPLTAPLLFTANDCLDLGSDLGSPVSLDYYDRAPFELQGTLGTTTIAYQ
jgi:arylsulfatase